jgi:hypothetical protein
MEDIKTVVELALELAEDLPEKYQTVAFEQILRHELAGAPASQVDTATEDKQVSSVGATTPSWADRLIDNLPEDHVIAKHGDRDQQTVWAVIALQDRDEEATTS